MTLNSHGNISTHLLGDVFMNQLYNIQLCFLLSNHPYYAPTAPSSLLLYSYYFSPSCGLCFPTCNLWKEKSHTLLIHKKWSLTPISIPWAITCKVISQMKGRNSELLLPPYSTRYLKWMQKCAEWRMHSLDAIGCLRHRHRAGKSDLAWSTHLWTGVN